jgi:hypothetical protein
VIGPVIAAMFMAAWDIFSASRAGMQIDPPVIEMRDERSHYGVRLSY